ETSDYERPIGIDYGERVMHNLLNRDLDKIRTGAGFHFTIRAARDFLELRLDWTRTKRGYGHAAAAQFRAERFRKTGDVRFGRRVNVKSRDRKKAGGRADIQNRASLLRNHLRQQLAREQRERSDVDLNHGVESAGLNRGEGPLIANAGVVNQEVDVDLVLLEPSHQLIDLRFVRKIDNAHLNAQLRAPILQFFAQLIQPLLAPRDEDEGTRSRRQLPRKFPADSSRSSGNERVAAVNFHGLSFRAEPGNLSLFSTGRSLRFMCGIRDNSKRCLHL